MSQFEFREVGLGKTASGFKRAANTEVKINLNEGLREIGRLIVPSKGTGPLANATPRGGTGDLAKSTFFQISGGPENQTLEILQPARTPTQYGAEFYGKFVREGTKAHRIEPRIKKVLRFKIGNDEVFSAGVNHPGTAPNPYHTQVLASLQPQIRQITERMAGRIIAVIAR